MGNELQLNAARQKMHLNELNTKRHEDELERLRIERESLTELITTLEEEVSDEEVNEYLKSFTE